MWFNSSPFKGNADRLPWMSPGTQTLPRKGFKSPGKSHLELGSGLGPSPGLILPPGHLDGIQDSRDPRDVGTSRIPLRVCPRGSAGIREHPRGASGDPGMPSTGITPLGTAAGLRSRECGAGHIPGAPSLRKELFENPEPGGMDVEPEGRDVGLSWESRPPAAPEAPPGHPWTLPRAAEASPGTFFRLSPFPQLGSVPRSFPCPNSAPLCPHPEHKSRLPFPVIASNPIPFPFQEESQQDEGAGAVSDLHGSPGEVRTSQEFSSSGPDFQP